ncbi:MAG TPA: three-Cys-motif partner protein TcmP [Tepidisphaeraceae bacterium]
MWEYEGREQSRAKHEILRGYLGRFAHIIGTWKSTITYVDCFSGPWDVQNTDLSDSSFAIAVEELRKARETLKQRNRDLKLRCFFLEERKSSYARLAAYAAGISDLEIETKNARLEHAVTEILKFVDAGGARSFPFFLIDPTGWTGFELDVIQPLLQRKPGEVVVNFMTSFIRRFINWDEPENQAAFDRTFGKFRPKREELFGVTQEDLDDVLVAAYSKLIRDIGGFDHVCNSIVLDPDKDSTHFNLIYATRDLKGVEAFKEVERRALTHHEENRARLRGAKVERKSGGGLFGPATFGSLHYDNLRDRYLHKARRDVIGVLNSQRIVKYDAVFASALTHPLVWEKDVKDLIRQWQSQRAIELMGLKPREKVPKLKQGHSLTALKALV